MVTAYYIMKMSSGTHEKWNITDQYFKEEITPKRKKNICRVCLRYGKIKIFQENSEIRDAIVIHGDIQISENDNLPKYLCNGCYDFITLAMLFRKTAKTSEEKLRQASEVEECVIDDGNQEDTDNVHCSDDYPNYSKSTTNWDEESLLPSEPEKKKQKARSVCKICNKVMYSSYYKEHMLVHQTFSNYVCEVCGKSFKLRCSYLNHKHRHQSGFPYKCPFCPYRGKYIGVYKSHMRTHTGDYRYMCTECPARFLYKSNLNSHLKKHKEPEFKCDSCKRAFHTNTLLKRHFDADHLGIKNHVCSICGKAFGYRNAMMKHQRNMHKREKCEYRRRPAYLAADQEQGEKH